MKKFVNAIYGSTYKDLQKEIEELKEKRKYDLCFINHLKQDKEKLEKIIDEVEKINEDQLTKIFKLNLKIEKTIYYINEELDKNKNKFSVVNDYNIFLDGMERAYMNCLEILGGDDNGM